MFVSCVLLSASGDRSPLGPRSLGLQGASRGDISASTQICGNTVSSRRSALPLAVLGKWGSYVPPLSCSISANGLVPAGPDDFHERMSNIDQDH